MGERNIKESKDCFPKIDDFWKNLIGQIFIVFVQIQVRQQDMLFSKLEEISAGINCKFPYKRTMLYAYLVKHGLQCQKEGNHKVIIKSLRLGAWRYKYLIQVQKYHEGDNVIVYLGENWFAKT